VRLQSGRLFRNEWCILPFDLYFRYSFLLLLTLRQAPSVEILRVPAEPEHSGMTAFRRWLGGSGINPLLHKPLNVRNRELRCVPSGGRWPWPLGPPSVVPLAAWVAAGGASCACDHGLGGTRLRA